MKRALLSVSDKRGLTDLARTLVDAGYELVSSGGTARHLRDAGLDVRPVEDVTGSPEILGGRVKTLHPKVHGGLLVRDDPDHRAEIDAQGITPIDVLVVNLYPFRETAADPSATPEEVIEQIDIGGPAMIRAAAKTHERVTVLVDPADYEEVGRTLLRGGTDADRRRALARKAFAHTAAYDAAIVRWFDDTDGPNDAGGELPETLHFALERVESLRYGENPHQRGARYREIGHAGFWDAAERLKGTAPSFLNLYDAEAAWRLVHAFDAPACVIVKHANPCGVAVAGTASEAYGRAFECDPVSAFGGVVALNREVDETTARSLMDHPKADVLIAPAYAGEALDVLRSKRKAMRVFRAPVPAAAGLDVRSLAGGLLVQTADRVGLDRSAWSVPTKRVPTDEEWRDLVFAWQVCAAASSNAIVLAKDLAAVGIGAGQQSRVDAGRIAATKAGDRARGGACASDAFYPFRDGLDAAAEAGVSAVVQPGGSVRDDELVAAADEHGIAMVMTGERHFRH